MGRTTDTEPLTFRTAGWMRPREEHIKTRSQNRRLEASTEPVTFSKDRPSTNGVPQPQLQPVQPSAKGSRRSTPMGPLATIALASESFQKLLKKSEEPFSKGEPHLHKADEFGVRSGTYTSGSDVRGFIRVYEYDHQGATYMIDADDSFVHFTAIWKALGKHKPELGKLSAAFPQFERYVRKIRGGYLKIQGSWVPFEIARELAKLCAWELSDSLIPLFGPSFPNECVRPDPEVDEREKRAGESAARTLSRMSIGRDYARLSSVDSPPTTPRALRSSSTVGKELPSSKSEKRAPHVSKVRKKAKKRRSLPVRRRSRASEVRSILSPEQARMEERAALKKYQAELRGSIQYLMIPSQRKAPRPPPPRPMIVPPPAPTLHSYYLGGPVSYFQRW